MNIFFESIKLNLKVLFYYRMNFVLTLILDPLLLIFKIMLFKAIFSYNDTNIILGYTINQMIWYFAGVNFIFYLVWNFTDKSLSDTILSGDIVVSLCKPISIIKWELAKAVSNKIGGILFEFLPGFFIYTLIAFPDFLTLFALVKFLILCVFAFLLLYLISFFIGITAFKLKTINSLHNLKMIIFNLAAGSFLPVDFYPAAMRKIITVLPFPYVCYVPIRFLLNQEETQGWDSFFTTIIIQSAWILILFFLSGIYWKRMVNQFCAAGG